MKLHCSSCRSVIEIRPFKDFSAPVATWSCARLNIGASVMVGAAGKIIYTCETECANGAKTLARFDVSYVGVGLGIELEFTGSHNNQFNDNNSLPSANMFNGNYIEVGAGGSFGMGYGIGAASINGGSARGGMSGNLTGISGGVGFGAAEVAGASRLIWERKVQCNEECK